MKSVLCEEHGLRYNPESHSGCVRCRGARGAGPRKSSFASDVGAALFLIFAAALTFHLLHLNLFEETLTGFPAAVSFIDVASASFEEELGELIFQRLRASGMLIESPELERQFTALAAPLLAAHSVSGHTFKLHISRYREVNAFALPGGHVVFHAGLILQADSAEEVLGVLGHEMAHVTRHHSLEAIVDRAGLGLTIRAIFGDLSGFRALAADGRFLLELAFSRRQEREADLVGLGYLVEAGVDPDGMLSFFEKMTARESAQENSLFSTHPATAERFDYLRRRRIEIAADGGFRRSTFDFWSFKRRVREKTAW